MRVVNPEKLRHLYNMPYDVRAILDLFPDLYFSTSHNGEYFDILTGDNSEYVFCQPFPGRRVGNDGEEINITGKMNKARFVSWVRHGMPSGYGEYENLWDKEDYDGWDDET